MLIGMFTGDVIVGSYPLAISLRALVELVPSRIGLQPANFEWAINGQAIASIEGQIDNTAQPDVPVLIALPAIPLQIEGEGSLELRYLGQDSTAIVTARKIISGTVPPKI